MATALSAYSKTRIEDEPRIRVSESILDLFSINAIDESGTFLLTGNRYSRTYVLSDMNFEGATLSEKKQMIESLASFYNLISCRFQITVTSQYHDVGYYRRGLYRLYGDSLDGLRNSYNEVIKNKLKGKKRGLYQRIYLTLTVLAEDFDDANRKLNSISASLIKDSIKLGIDGKGGSQMYPLNINERMQLLYDFSHKGITGGFAYDFEREIRKRSDFLSTLSPSKLSLGNTDFDINGQWGSVLYFSKFPQKLFSNIISSLTEIECESFISINNEPIDSAALTKEINKKYMTIGMKIENQKSGNRARNDYLSDASTKLLSQKEKLDILMEKAESEGERFFNTTGFIMFLTESKESLKDFETKFVAKGSEKSIEIKPCFAKQKEGINSALPLGIQEFKRSTNFNSKSLAMFMPFRTQELSDKDGTWYGINQISQNAIYANKKIQKNNNGLILGQSGSGKSVFSKHEMISIYLNNPKDQVIVIDPQSEYSKISGALNGSVISFDSAKNYYLNPLDIDFKDLDYAEAQEMIADKCDFIISLLSSCTRLDFSAEEISALDNVVGKVYANNYSIRRRLNGYENKERIYNTPNYMKDESATSFTKTTLSYEEQVREYSPTMQDIYQGLLDERNDICDHLARSVDIFVNGSLNLFNHKTNVDTTKRFLVFDISRLKENLRVPSMLIMLELVKAKILANAKNDFWTHLYIDEFHELLSVPKVSEFVLKLWKEIRKMNGVLTGITQNMRDLQDKDTGGNLASIVSNTEFFALLSQGSDDRTRLMEIMPTVSEELFSYVNNAPSGTGLLRIGAVSVPFDMKIDTKSEIYKLINTDSSAQVSL